MKKFIASELVSLDGVMESPEEWPFSYSNNGMAKELSLVSEKAGVSL